MRKLYVVECSCHYWIVDAFTRPGRCGRCGERGELRGEAEPWAKTTCKHTDGDCRSPGDSMPLQSPAAARDSGA